MCNPSSQCKHTYRHTAAGTACSGNDGGVPGCLLWGQYYIIIYLRVSKRQTKGMPKTSFTFGNFHFTLFIARRACVYYYYYTRTIMPMTVHVPTYVCAYLSPESKCVAFRRTRPRRNHHRRRSSPPPSPVSAKYYILFRKPFATYTFSYLFNIT